MAVEYHQIVVAIGRGFGGERRARDAIASTAIVDDDLLPEGGGKTLSDDPSDLGRTIRLRRTR